MGGLGGGPRMHGGPRHSGMMEPRPPMRPRMGCTPGCGCVPGCLVAFIIFLGIAALVVRIGIYGISMLFSLIG